MDFFNGGGRDIKGFLPFIFLIVSFVLFAAMTSGNFFWFLVGAVSIGSGVWMRQQLVAEAMEAAPRNVPADPWPTRAFDIRTVGTALAFGIVIALTGA